MECKSFEESNSYLQSLLIYFLMKSMRQDIWFEPSDSYPLTSDETLSFQLYSELKTQSVTTEEKRND